MENINITLSAKDLKDIVQDSVKASVLKSMNTNKEQIERSIDSYFKKGMFNNNSTDFESDLDWGVEQAFREGLTQAMEELGYKELIAQKAKEVLSDNNFIKELAEKKVRASLGLTNI